MKNGKKVSHVGLDCHKKFSTVTARDARNEVVFRARLEHADRQKLRRELARWPKATPVVLEGTFGWGWMADELRDAGHDPHLASSRKVAAWRDARGLAKSNRIDANLLSEIWPQQPRWWEVWLAPQEVRDQREWLRYRMALVGVQTMTKNRIHATLHRHGIQSGASDLFGQKGRAFLKLLIEADEPLRDAARKTLAGHLRLLEQVRGQIAAATRELRRQVARHAQAELWRSLPGIGWVLAYTIQAEIGNIKRFRDSRHLSSYGLLAPRANDSGDEGIDTPIGRHVGHAGRRTLKWAFIEAAHGAVRKSKFFRAIFDRHTDGGQKNRNRGYITVARQLCHAGFACVSKARRYTEDRPARPGSQKHSDNGQLSVAVSYPGLGQPEDPMVAAAS
jgi:transposase